MYVGENESAKFWLSILNGLKNRGVQDILIACIDGLTGFPQAISAVFPETEIHHCIIHKIRNSYKDLKALMADLKRFYVASTEEIARLELDAFAEKRDDKYPNISKSWREDWATLSTYFKYPDEIHKIIYTTNTVEGFNRQLRKVTKNKSIFLNDDSLLKMLYLAAMDITKKWTGRRQDWGKIRWQLMIFFEDRLDNFK
jgi:transposase-like protein